jgi:hypothetical protein
MMDRDLPHDPQLDGLSTGDAVLRRLAELVAAETRERLASSSASSGGSSSAGCPSSTAVT